MPKTKAYTWWTEDDEARAREVIRMARETLPERVAGHDLHWPGGWPQKRSHEAYAAELYGIIQHFVRGAVNHRGRGREWDMPDLVDMVAGDILGKRMVYWYDPARASVYTFLSMVVNQQLAHTYRVGSSGVLRNQRNRDVLVAWDDLDEDEQDRALASYHHDPVETVELVDAVMGLARDLSCVPEYWRDHVFVPALEELVEEVLGEQWMGFDSIVRPKSYRTTTGLQQLVEGRMGGRLSPPLVGVVRPMVRASVREIQHRLDLLYRG